MRVYVKQEGWQAMSRQVSSNDWTARCQTYNPEYVSHNAGPSTEPYQFSQRTWSVCQTRNQNVISRYLRTNHWKHSFITKCFCFHVIDFSHYQEYFQRPLWIVQWVFNICSFNPWNILPILQMEKMRHGLNDYPMAQWPRNGSIGMWV